MIEPDVLQRAQSWLEGEFDRETKEEVRRMMEEDHHELTEAFYKNLEFGTGGLRGIMGAGTNRMNKYTVGMATQGFANYIRKQFPDIQTPGVAIAYDSRNNSPFFAEKAADVLSANGIRVFLFESLRPTPELSFAIRFLGCQAGIVITASHNPPEYNGYKAYWEDGGQLVAPHDNNVIEEVNRIGGIDEVRFARNKELVQIIGEEIDTEYIRRVKGLSLNPDIIKKHSDLRIVYTPIHGTGVKIVPEALKEFGFQHIIHVPEQDHPDGYFPTVKSPNPEEAEALDMAISKARETGADIVMATDPDADRVGIAVRNRNGRFELINGNQTAALLIYYLLNQWKEKDKITGKEYIIKTIVTTDLLNKMADFYGVRAYETLTGFKYIAEVMRNLEGKETFIGGGEESYGYLVGDFVRDKDAVISCCMIAEAAAWAASRGKTLYELLPEIYQRFGFFREKLYSLVKKGKEGSEEIKKIMEGYRNNPPRTIQGVDLVVIRDILTGKQNNLQEGTITDIALPSSNVLQFILADGARISVRPSGTEPKIKYYFSVQAKMDDVSRFEKTAGLLDERIEAMARELEII
mgnify:CR=1 FL=1